MHDDVDQSVTFYSNICGVKGFAWVVVADISSYNFEGSNEFTFVISDETAEVECVMDQNGISMDIHLNENRKYKK